MSLKKSTNTALEVFKREMLSHKSGAASGACCRGLGVTSNLKKSAGGGIYICIGPFFHLNWIFIGKYRNHAIWNAPCRVRLAKLSVRAPICRNDRLTLAHCLCHANAKSLRPVK